MPVHFTTRALKGEPGRVVVQVLLQWSRHRRVQVTTTIRLQAKHWSADRERLKPSAPGAVKTNAELEQIEAEAYAEMASGGTDAEIRTRMLKRLGRTKKEADTLVAVYDTWADRKKSTISKGTGLTYDALRGHLVSVFGESAPLSTVAGDFLERFSRELARGKLATTTANKLTSKLRPFAEWVGETYGIVTRLRVKPLATAQGDPVFLTQDELRRLVSLDLSGEIRGFGAARDLFIAGAVTGQRFGDVVAMRWDQINRSAEAWTWHVATQKTGAVRRVPIAAPLRRILDAREGEPTPLPVLSNQKANEYLRDVCRLAEINAPVTTQTVRGGERIAKTVPKWQAVTTHAARKTFTTLLLEGGAPLTSLLGLTHDNLAALNRYVGRSEAGRRTLIGNTFSDL